MLSTTDLDTAPEWWEHLAAAGVEGLVAKLLTAPYRPGRSSGCRKIRT
ncbi:hypothetical protein ACFVUW_15280 [Streptomyces xiamenensis]